jgi:hypothetical protein
MITAPWVKGGGRDHSAACKAVGEAEIGKHRLELAAVGRVVAQEDVASVKVSMRKVRFMEVPG